MFQWYIVIHDLNCYLVLNTIQHSAACWLKKGSKQLKFDMWFLKLSFLTTKNLKLNCLLQTSWGCHCYLLSCCLSHYFILHFHYLSLFVLAYWLEFLWWLIYCDWNGECFYNYSSELTLLPNQMLFSYFSILLKSSPTQVSCHVLNVTLYWYLL